MLTGPDSKVSKGLLAAGIMAGAIFLRLMGLKKGIWLDEYATLRILSAPDFLQALRLHDHPSLYYVLLKLWSKMGGSIVYLRIFSVLCGIGTVVVLMAWIRQYSRLASLLAGIYAATLPLMLRYSQEIVDYPLFLLATALSFFFTSQILAFPSSRPRHIGLAVSLSAVVLAHALGIVVVAAVAVYYFSSCPFQTKTGHRKVILAFGASFLVFVFFVFLFLHGIKKDPATWWVPPISAGGLAYVARSLFGMDRLFGPASMIFLFVFSVLLFFGSLRRSWPLLAAAIFYWLALIGYSLMFIPVLLERTALPGMIPFMGFVGVHISTIREKIPRTVFMIIFLLLSSAFVFSWFQIADKPIEPTGEAVSVLETMRHQKDLVVIFPQLIEGLIGHYAQLPSSSVLGVQPTDDAASVEEKIEPMLKMQRLGFNTGPHSVFLLMRSSPLFKRRPEVYLWLIEYLKQRFGDPVFFRQFGCFSITQFKE